MKSLSKGEAVFLFLVFLVFSASASALYFDTFHTGRNRQGLLVGSITYKNRTAEQKQAGSNLWFEAPQDGPVYNFDTIRTGLGSSAIIELGPQGKIELGEESMVLIRIENRKATIELAGGSLQVTNTEAATPVSLETASGKISVTSGSILLQESGGAVSLRSVGGDAAIDTGEASPVTVSSADSFNLTERVVREDTISVRSPAQNAFLVSTTERTPVTFSWDPPTTTTSLEISTDRTFTKIAYRNEAASSGETVNLIEGSYYWRLPAEAASGFFTVLRGKAPVITASASRTFMRTGSPVSVPFSWSKAGTAELFRLEVYSSSAGADAALIISKITAQRSLLLDFDTEGSWYWTVSALIGPDGVPFASTRGTFTVSAKSPSPPSITSASKRMITWEPVSPDATYELRVLPATGSASAVLQTSTQNTWHAPANTLPAGVWMAEVRAIIAGTPGEWGSSKPFTINEIRPLVPQTPAPSATIPLSEKKITLSWKDPNEGAQYHLLVSANTDFSKPATDTLITRPTYALQPASLTTGTWYWKVSLASDNESVSASPVQSFTLVDKLDAPKPIAPVSGEQLELNDLDHIKLGWKADPLADEYIVRMYRMTGGIRLLIGEWTTKDSELIIDDLSIFALDSFAWELVAVKNAGTAGSITSEPVLSYFRIVQTERLALPSIRTMKTKGGY